MLFINHDDAKINDRSKERRARTNDDLDLAGGDAQPGIESLSICHPAV
jgi:hypothetical protein